MRVLIVKTSSLGDLIHTLPAVTDAAKAMPGVRFDWVAEEAFAEIPGWHRAVDRTIPIALRRWRKDWRRTWTDGELPVFLRQLREREYDLIIDAQGLLLKSAVAAGLARGPRHGLAWASAREPLSALLYRSRHKVPKDRHAVERVRQLFAAALGYGYDATGLDYGLDRSRFPSPVEGRDYLVFLHGTSWPSKRLATEHWIALGRRAADKSQTVYLPWGSEEEKRVAEAIAASCPNARVLPRLNLAQLAGLLAQAQGIIGVDTGLAHLGAALGVSGVALYTTTFPALTGARGVRQSCLLLGCDAEPPPAVVPHLRVLRSPAFNADAVWRAMPNG